MLKKTQRVKWLYMDNLKAYYLYRKSKRYTSKETRNYLLSHLLSKDKLRSVQCKLSNYRYLDTGRGFEHCSIESEDVFSKYKDQNLEHIKKEIKKIEKTSAGQSNLFNNRLKIQIKTLLISIFSYLDLSYILSYVLSYVLHCVLADLIKLLSQLYESLL